LCEEHFIYFFEKRVKRTVKNFGMIAKKEKIAVALSGGKDSITTLNLLHNIYGSGHSITAIMIDEGIEGYRNKAIAIAKKNCEELQIPYKVLHFNEHFGKTMDEIAGQKSTGSCSYCGVLRRDLLNTAAFEQGADKLATGHNLDDETQSIAMNFFNNDLAKMQRLGAVTESSYPGFVARIKPLYETPEKDVVTYAAFKGLKHYNEQCCPYCETARRNHYRELIENLEKNSPEIKFSLLNTFSRIKPLLKENEKGKHIEECIKCGKPTSREVCRVCEKLGELSMTVNRVK